MFFEVKNLNFAYLKSPLCLKDVSFSFDKNDKLLLLASKGQGKTTFVKVVSSFCDKYFGWILMDGKELKTIDDKDKSFSLLLAEPVFFENKTIKQNLDYFCDVQSLKSFSNDEINEFLENFKLNAKSETKVKKLSIDDKQKLQILRCCLKQPKVVFVDDIFSKANSSIELFQLFKEKILSLNSAVVLALGDDTFKNLCGEFENCGFDKVLYLNLAKLLSYKTINEFKNSFSSLDVTNFLDGYNCVSVTLERDKNCYFLNFDNDKVVRLHSAFNNKLNRLGLEILDTEPCKIAAKLQDLGDINLEENVNELLRNNKVYLFSALDYTRVI